MLPKDFYNQVENPGSLKRVLYSDTDSIFITIPTNKSPLEMEMSDKWNLVIQTANQINNAISKYLKEYLLPKSNINPEHNMTDFKSELMMSGIFFTGVKKSYAYKLECKEGKELDPPKIKYTGIQVVKTDTAKLTQELLNDMIENVMLNYKIENKLEALIEIIEKYKNKFNNFCDNLETNEIGLPGKWGKKKLIINGMILYNFLMNEEVFSMSSSGKFVYCKFTEPKLLNGKIDISKTNGICFPYEFDKTKLKLMMDQYGIEIDRDVHWGKLFTTTCDRVIEVAKD